MNDILGIIPARYASTRFPGKPLAMLGEKPMIQWVYESASCLFEHLVVATDDSRILQAVDSFGGRAVMTSPDHRTGTERCAEAYNSYEQESGHRFDHVVNIQGDEPLIKREQLEILVDCLRIPGTSVATLIRQVQDPNELEDPNVVKVVVDQTFRALYFSRSPIPHLRDHPPAKGNTGHNYYTHIGLYGYLSRVLQIIVKLPPSPLEQAESLEQLRWMEHGIPIQTRITNIPTMGVDTPGDLEKIRDRI